MSLTDLDLQILQLINISISPAIDTLFLIISYSIYAYMFFIAWIYYRSRQKEKFIHFFISVIVGFIFATILKTIVARPRPHITFPTEIHTLLYGNDPSFPSRHTFIAFVLLKFIPKSFSKIFRYLSITYLFLIPFTQMYIGVHYPSDVLAGAVLGFIFPYILNERVSLRIWNLIPKQISNVLNKFF